MTLYAIDPGTEQSALVWINASGSVHGQMWSNDALVMALRGSTVPHPAHLVIEQIESFGMPVGAEVFETAFWSGRFAEAWRQQGLTCSFSRIGRKAVKLALCGTVKAKDANIRQALIDRFGGPSCIKKGGPLHGIKSHLWAALAVAVAYQDLAAFTKRHEGAGTGDAVAGSVDEGKAVPSRKKSDSVSPVVASQETGREP